MIDKAEKVYLLVHRNKSKDKAGKYAARIQRDLKAVNIEIETVPCNWENIEEITRVVRDLILQETDNEIVLNLSGGSKNHSVGIDRACMTLEKRDHVRMIGVTPKKWAAPKYPKQLSTGVSTVTVIGIHRVIPPPKELIFAMKVIKQDSIDIPYNKGKKGVKKKDLSKSLFGNNNNVALTKLQRTITQPLQDTWLAIKIIKVGRSDWISLTKEGRYLRYVLDKQETY